MLKFEGFLFIKHYKDALNKEVGEELIAAEQRFQGQMLQFYTDRGRKNAVSYY